LPHVAADDADQIAEQLFKMTPDMPAASKAKIRGFVKPASLDGIKQALKSLQIAPYNG
jgi:hypothetical protein